MSIDEKIVVVGAGQMGLGIAHAFVASGFPVTMVDISDQVLEKARTKIDGILKESVERGKADQASIKRAMSLLSQSLDVKQAAEGASLVIETASENLQIKIDIICAADSVLDDDAVIATNTSALSITEMAATSTRPDRVVGMHFFNPVHKMKLVEIIKGLQTTAQVVAKVRRWSEQIGKTSIVVNEAPGFTTSRISAMLGNEAMWMLHEGVASAADIDTALKLAFRHPMGPLELGDLTGWDTRLEVLKYLHQTLGEKFRPCPLIHKMVKAGRHGRKTGHGVYKYVDGVKEPESDMGIQP